MKNTVKLLPPTSGTTFTANGDCYRCYGDGRYMFSDPTPQRKYVKILATVRSFMRKGMAPTRNAVKAALGMPLAKGWGASTWTALSEAGLLDHRRAARTTVYFLTPRGLDFLKQLDHA